MQGRSALSGADTSSAQWTDIMTPAVDQHSAADSGSTAQQPATDIVLLVGPPATGKSTLARQFEKQLGYVHVNRDTVGTMDKCVHMARVALSGSDSGGSSSNSSKRSVVIDNTNLTPAVRGTWIRLANELHVQVSS